MFWMTFSIIQPHYQSKLKIDKKNYCAGCASRQHQKELIDVALKAF